MKTENVVNTVAKILSKVNWKLSGKTLAKLLNLLGCRTQNGDKYAGERGIYHLLSTLYDKAVQNGDESLAKKIATCFKGKNGYPWDK